MIAVFLCAQAFTTFASSTAEAVDARLAPPNEDSSELAGVYSDMIVVQRKAKEKKGHALFSSYGTLEFSDGPQSITTLNFDVGYAVSDRVELYLNFAPLFLTSDRNIKTQVESLQLANGQQAQLLTPKPKFQFGAEFLWLPAYGKDSWSPFSIVRSDTFFKFYAGTLQFDGGSGLRGSIGVGKTFFLSKFFNPRLSASFCVQENYVNDQKSLSKLGLFEIGSVWYL